MDHYWTRLMAVDGAEPYTSTAVVDVEDGCVVVAYELLVDMLTQLGFVETKAAS